MKKQIFFSTLILTILIGASTSWAAVDRLGKFNHDGHLNKIFKPQNIECSHCHNYTHDANSNKVVFNDQAQFSIFKRSLKEICHECHQSDSPKHKDAPQTCFTCHSSFEDIRNVKPANHGNIVWKTTHSLDARISGDSCFNCHTTSQCSKCHFDRNDIELANHSRNYKFTHSVQARATPSRCDSCHTKSYCISCHMGKK